MPYRNTFRPRPWLAVFLAVAFLGALGGIGFRYPYEGWSGFVIALSLFALVCLVGIADFLVSKVVLGGESLEVVELHRRRRYPRSELVSAKVDGGSVCVKRERGDWVNLPDVGNALGVCNSVRAWLEEYEKEGNGG